MFEKVVLQNLITNHTYSKKFISYITKEYLILYESKVVFRQINEYFNEFKKPPHYNELLISINNNSSLNEQQHNDCIDLVEEIKSTDDNYNLEWLAKETKKWIRNKAFENVIVESAEKLQNDKSIDDMMQKVKEVFVINFDETIGINFREGAEKQLAYYKEEKIKYPSNIRGLDLICDGGIEPKTLNLLMAPTNTGKTSAMISLASNYLKSGYRVLYVTCEMSEENIRQRIEANLLDISINDIPKLPEALYLKRMNEIGQKYMGNIYIKEYPTKLANVNHIRSLLDNLATKESFMPQIVIIDYLNILKSATINNGGSSYDIVKSIAEEVRGLACEYYLAIWSATQTNRDGDGASDLNLNNSSDSYGVPMTVDLEVAIIQTPLMAEQKKQVWKCLKTRYSELRYYRFNVEHNFHVCQIVDLGDAQSENTSDIQHNVNKVNNRERMQDIGIIDFE